MANDIDLDSIETLKCLQSEVLDYNKETVMGTEPDLSISKSGNIRAEWGDFERGYNWLMVECRPEGLITYVIFIYGSGWTGACNVSGCVDRIEKSVDALLKIYKMVEGLEEPATCTIH